MAYGQARIPIGQRRERVQLQRADVQDDGMGGQQITRWRTIAEPFVAVIALDERTKENIEGGKIVAKHAYHLAMSYRNDLQPSDLDTMRIVYRGQVLDIQSAVDDEGKKRRLMVQCEQVQGSESKV